jgi:hypothetical protein
VLVLTNHLFGHNAAMMKTRVPRPFGCNSVHSTISAQLVYRDLLNRLHYNPVMTRLVYSCLLSFAFSLSAAAQVKIHVPQQHHKKYEKISASVENAGTKRVTFCVEFGQWSPKGDGEVETTPYPFWIQQKHNAKWNTLILGPDVGSVRRPVVLDPGKSMDFPFRLGGSGAMRLRLSYWSGDLSSLDCDAPPKGAKRVTSSVFTIDE